MKPLIVIQVYGDEEDFKTANETVEKVHKSLPGYSFLVIQGDVKVKVFYPISVTALYYRLKSALMKLYLKFKGVAA
jgi:hypothetical protein